jgi:phospholipid/cholesterol/gamma-HCH transport system permease protein
LRLSDPVSASLCGAWTIHTAQQAASLVAEQRYHFKRIDVADITALDTTGVALLLSLLADSDTPASQRIYGLSEARSGLLELLTDDAEQVASLPSSAQRLSFTEQLASLGQRVTGRASAAGQMLGFFGLVLETLLRSLWHPRRWRITSWVFHIHRTGLDAVPIIGLLSFLVGAVIAFLGARVLSQFGAEVFAVEMVSYAFLREFGVLLAAILVAGRSGSAFTAQIGSMQSREEVDALRTIGVNPLEVLVLPRLLALLVSLPLLTFIANIAGLLGGVLATWFFMDISPTLFYTRLVEYTPVSYLWLGLVKAPVFALIIATIGAREGLKVRGSAESVGYHTTSSVVQSIFWVIVVDAFFAVLFMELDL